MQRTLDAAAESGTARDTNAASRSIWYALGATAVFLAAALYFVLIELHRPSATTAFDIYIYFLPNKIYAAASAWRGGSGLLWNPYQSCGEPFFANTAMGLLYPLHVLFLVMEPNAATHVVLILNMVIAATGMLLLGRQLGLGWIAAIGGALVLELGDPMAHLTGWSPMQSGPWAWLPWALFLCERLLRAPTRLGIAGLAAVLTLELLPGWVLITALTYQVIALRLLWELMTVGRAPAWRPILAVAAGMVLAPCLAAVQLVPAAELARESFRVAVEVGDFVAYGAGVPDLARIIRSRVPPLPFMVGPLLMALAAPFFSERRRLVAFYALIGVIYGVLALGHGTPLFALYAKLPPGAATLRYPTRLFWLCGLSLAMLSALAIDAFSRPRESALRWVGCVVVVAAAIALYAFTPGGLRWAEIGAATAIGCAALLASARPVFAQPAAWVAVGAVALNLTVVPLHYPGRLMSSLDAYQEHRDVFDYLAPAISAQDRIFIMSSTASLNRTSLMQKTATLMQVPDIHDYEALLGRRHTEFITALWRGMPINSVGDLFDKHSVMGGLQRRLLDLAAVRYVLVAPEADPTGWGLELPVLTQPDPGVVVYRNDHALPRARFVPRIEVIPDRSVLLNRLMYGDDDLSRVAFVEAPMPTDFTGQPGDVGAGSARFVRDDPEHIVVEVEAPARGFLVLADQDYPGWQATVNGRAAPIHLANHMFRLVEVPPGRSTVEFRYRPRSLALGGLVSLVGFAALGGLIWGGRRVRAKQT